MNRASLEAEFQFIQTSDQAVLLGLKAKERKWYDFAAKCFLKSKNREALLFLGREMLVVDLELARECLLPTNSSRDLVRLGEAFLDAPTGPDIEHINLERAMEAFRASLATSLLAKCGLRYLRMARQHMCHPLIETAVRLYEEAHTELPRQEIESLLNHYFLKNRLSSIPQWKDAEELARKVLHKIDAS